MSIRKRGFHIIIHCIKHSILFNSQFQPNSSTSSWTRHTYCIITSLIHRFMSKQCPSNMNGEMFHISNSFALPIGPLSNKHRSKAPWKPHLYFVLVPPSHWTTTVLSGEDTLPFLPTTTTVPRCPSPPSWSCHFQSGPRTTRQPTSIICSYLNVRPKTIFKTGSCFSWDFLLQWYAWWRLVESLHFLRNFQGNLGLRPADVTGSSELTSKIGSCKTLAHSWR